MKTVFLLALASARRRSYLVVSLLPEAGFLAMNQLPSHAAQWIQQKTGWHGWPARQWRQCRQGRRCQPGPGPAVSASPARMDEPTRHIPALDTVPAGDSGPSQPGIAHLSPSELERMFCPVRQLKLYLRDSERIRGSRQRLFIHWNCSIRHHEKSYQQMDHGNCQGGLHTS